MSIYRYQIEEMMQNCSKVLENYIREYLQCTEGGTACCKTHGKVTFYHTCQKDGKYIRTVIDRDSDMIKELAGKEYLNRSISGRRSI